MKIKESLGSRIFDGFNILFMVGIMIITVYPFYQILIVSISDPMQVMLGNVKWYPIGITWASYAKVFKEASIWRCYLNTIIYTVSGTAVNMVMTACCAYPLSRPDMPFKSIFTQIILLTMFFSGGMIPGYLLILNLHLKNTIWAIILPGAISTYNMIVMRTFFQGIPNELHESAEIDGAHDLTILCKIILPLSIPCMATLTLFYAVGHWNSWFNALLYLDSQKQFPVQLLLREILNNNMGDLAVKSGVETEITQTSIKYAVIIVTTLPILCVYPFIQKYFVKGVMVGSIKG